VDYYSIAIETLAFLYEILKSHDLRYICDYMIRISNLSKIAKIDSIQLAILYYTLGISLLLSLIISYNYITNKEVGY
jgi:hypothetical protein